MWVSLSGSPCLLTGIYSCYCVPLHLQFNHLFTIYPRVPLSTRQVLLVLQLKLHGTGCLLKVNHLLEEMPVSSCSNYILGWNNSATERSFCHGKFNILRWKESEGTTNNPKSIWPALTPEHPQRTVQGFVSWIIERCSGLHGNKQQFTTGNTS